MSRFLAALCIAAAALIASVRAQDDKPPAIVGDWSSIDRHVAMGSLYQPTHGVRKRESLVHFSQAGVQLRGYAIHADHKQIVNQQRWKDGRTEFRKVTFEDNRLTFEFDSEWRKDDGPLAVEKGELENKGTIRVEALLKDGHLAGTWKMFLVDGTEVFRGEWEAVRAKAEGKPEAPGLPQLRPAEKPAQEPKEREKRTETSPKSIRLASSLVRSEEGVCTRGEWGEWRRYFRGETPTTRDMVVLAVTLKPGEAPHPPHQHTEEEFMILAEGAGTWHLDGKDVAARKGDVIYAAPQTMHGVKNTGDGPLTYYMVKWGGKEGADEPPKPQARGAEAEKGKVVRDEVKGSINHARGSTWKRVIGQARALDASTLEFADGTKVELDITVPAPNQMAFSGDKLYPCGQEAAEFLRNFIGDQRVMAFENGDGPWMAYVGDTNLERLMVVSGWALADHSSLHADEIIARENKRGLWRGRFLHPDTWRAGMRLPGESPPPLIASEREARQLVAAYDNDEEALPLLIARIVHDVPTLKQLSFSQNSQLIDDGLEQLTKLVHLEALDLAGCWRISDAGLIHLKSLPHLKHLVLPHITSNPGLGHLKSLAELETLIIDHWRGEPVTDAGLAHLKGLHNLKHLILNGVETTDAGLVHLQDLQNLTVLELGKMPLGDVGLTHLCKLQNLQHVDLSQSEVTDAGALQLISLKKLRAVLLPDRVTQETRKRLQEALPDLKFEGKPEDLRQ